MISVYEPGLNMSYIEEVAKLKKINYNIGLSNLKELYLQLKQAYYNQQALVSDEEFDKLEDFLKKKVPASWKGFKTGTKIKNKKLEMKLPISMPSLNKIYPDAVENWLEQSNASEIVLMEKLDGAALEVEFEDGLPSQAYTRGDGVMGKRMSYLLPHMKGLPKRLSTKSKVIIRCEGLFNKSKFRKYELEFKHARGAANGILNKGAPHPALKDLSVVVLQILYPNVKMSKGLRWAKAKGFTVVPFKTVKKSVLNINRLSKLLIKRKRLSKYQCDGLVLAENIVPPIARSATKPEWMVAFKQDVALKDAPKTKVIKIVYQVSSHGWLIPKIEVKPINIEGSTIRFCSAKNTRWMLKNGVGPGAIVRIVRAGDIIPEIVEVVKRSSIQQKPDRKEFGDYTINKGGTDYVLVNPKENSKFRLKHLTRFFISLGIDFMKEGTVAKLIDAGMDNVKKIYNASEKDFLRAEGIKERGAQKVYEAIHRVLDKGVPLPDLMDASGVFPRGIGTRRVEMIAAEYDLNKLMRMPADKVQELVENVKGFNTTTAKMFASKLEKFVKWQRITGIKSKAFKKEREIKGGKLSGKSVYLTGYRNPEQEQIIKKNGGRIHWGSDTDILLYSPAGKASGKIGKAKAKGIPVLTWKEFERKYL